MNKPAFKVAITSPSFVPEVEQEILKDLAEVIITDKIIATEEELLAFARDAHALCLGSLEPVTRRVIEDMPNLKVLARYGIGLDNIDIKAATEHGVLVTNDPDYALAEVADHTFTFILALTKRLVKMDRMMKAGRWTEVKREVEPIHAHAALTLGLLGLGNIARRVAARAKPFSFKVIGYDPWVPNAEFDLLGVERISSLDDFLRASDLISVHTPLTPQTRHMIGARELALMKPSAQILNTSRGGVIDQAALCRALEQGKIAGAALDVFESEPLAPDDPILSLGNVILTPHIAWYSEESHRRVRYDVARAVADVLSGRRPMFIVNPDAIR